MTEKGMENNKVTVIGTIVSGFTFSHAVFGEGFYLVDLLAYDIRTSDRCDERLPGLYNGSFRTVPLLQPP